MPGTAIQQSAKRDVVSIGEFLDGAMTKLGLRPSNLDEVEAANNAYVDMNSQQADLQARFPRGLARAHTERWCCDPE